MTQRSRSAPPRPSVTRRGVAGTIVALIVIVLALFALAFFTLNDLLVDRLWFESIGQVAVWDLNTFSRLLLWVPITIVAFLVLTVSVWLAVRSAGEAAPKVTRIRKPIRGRATPQGYEPPPAEDVIAEVLATLDDIAREISPRVLGLTLTGVALVLAMLIGLSTSAEWQTLLLFQNQATDAAAAAAAASGPGATLPVATALDPVFGRPLTFYLFDMPFLRAAAELVGSILDALILLSALAYLALVRRSMSRPSGRIWAWHLGILIGLRVAIGAVGFQLDKYSLVFQQRPYPLPAGVNATDAAVRLPAADILTVLTVVVAVVVLLAIVRQRFTWAVAAFGGWALVAVAALLLAVVNQSLFVNPNPLVQERAFIQNDIAATRLSYGLDGWTTTPYPATTALTAEAIVRDADTFANARLWDYRPLGATLDQLQTVRQYYDFTDVDIDRYLIDGKQRQVMLSAREMAIDKNPSAANWLNTHFIYTHGYGVAMVPVNAVQPDGLPDLIIRDMPVVSEPGAPVITEPRIYFGERAAPWIITGAQTDEFDFPSASGDTADATTRWKGTTGIRIGDGINRLLLSIWTGDFVSLLTSPQITDDSQILLRRTVGERLESLAPFLSWDRDPYLVITPEGRLVWIVDGYTTTDRFPMARAFASAGVGGGVAANRDFNYIRNAVKATVDAYDGTVQFYINDPSDPLIATWSAIYPSLFTSLDALPPALDPHLRYPEGMFNVQTGMYEAYHVKDPTTFYQGDNLWTVPNGPTGQSQVLPSEAYYVQMRLPGADATEYLLMQPMVPARRPNMIAWIAARNDGDNRGQVAVYQLPADTSIFGPAQIEARIDQTPEIASQITLWDQAGSSVIRGNLIVVPVGGSFVYLSPIYLQSTGSAFPQFTKIVVATPSKVVWADTLAEALRLAVGEDSTGPLPTPGPNATPGPDATPRPDVTPRPDDGTLPADVNALIAFANEHFALAQQAIGDGDYVTYGQEMALVQAALEKLAQLTGS